jgi:energy-coupling factor transport system permease protein
LTYRPGTSVLHRLHPLNKIGWLIFLTIFVFMSPSLVWVIALLGLVLIVFVKLGLSFREVPGIRIFLVTAFLLALLQVLFTHQGEIVGRMGPIEITDVGLINGGTISARFLVVIFLSFIFVLTTSPNDLAYGLMQAGLPYRYGFALVTALRFVPIFEKEAQTIYQAQLMRGVRYDRGSLRRLITLARQLTLPVLVSALRKVDALAVSMEGRSFGRYTTRSYYRPIQVSRMDYISAGILTFLILAFILLYAGSPIIEFAMRRF